MWYSKMTILLFIFAYFSSKYWTMNIFMISFSKGVYYLLFLSVLFQTIASLEFKWNQRYVYSTRQIVVSWGIFFLSFLPFVQTKLYGNRQQIDFLKFFIHLDIIDMFKKVQTWFCFTWTSLVVCVRNCQLSPSYSDMWRS